MKLKYWTVLLFLFNSRAFAQDYPAPAHQHTSPNPGGRFEIVQSPLAAKWTFRLDRYAGRVWQLVRTKDEDNAWEEMVVFGLAKLQSPSRPRFQIFTSGIAARHTFLLDTDSGRTWTLTTGKAKNKDGVDFEYTGWQSFSE